MLVILISVTRKQTEQKKSKQPENFPKTSEELPDKSKKETGLMKCIKAVDGIASLQVTRSLLEEKGICFIKIQILDVTAEAVSQKHLPQKWI